MKRLELVDGAQVNAPSAGTVKSAVSNLSALIEFVVLRETAGGFVQAAWVPSAHLRQGSYLLETNGEHVDGHVQAEVEPSWVSSWRSRAGRTTSRGRHERRELDQCCRVKPKGW